APVSGAYQSDNDPRNPNRGVCPIVGRTLTALFIGDVIGRPGIRAVFTHLKQLIKKTGAEIVVVNGENAADGFGLTPEAVSTIFAAGANVITSGNHIWQKKEVFNLLDSEPRLLRPANYPAADPGHGHCVVEVKGTRVAVVNLQGRVRMPRTDCPFRKANDLLRILSKEADVVMVDFHAEATDEKEALAAYLDGRIAAQVGTHTHVPTADARILPEGTAYITDLGASGPAVSVIGFNPDISIRRALTQIPIKNEVSESLADINGAVVVVDLDTGLAQSIETIRERSVV
ncbi:MAG: TIGR00282 family metallophosphoesterase, partial [Spirochaetia bacterium]